MCVAVRCEATQRSSEVCVGFSKAPAHHLRYNRSCTLLAIPRKSRVLVPYLFVLATSTYTNALSIECLVKNILPLNEVATAPYAYLVVIFKTTISATLISKNFCYFCPAYGGLSTWMGYKGELYKKKQHTSEARAKARILLNGVNQALKTRFFLKHLNLLHVKPVWRIDYQDARCCLAMQKKRKKRGATCKPQS